MIEEKRLFGTLAHLARVRRGPGLITAYMDVASVMEFLSEDATCSHCGSTKFLFRQVPVHEPTIDGGKVVYKLKCKMCEKEIIRRVIWMPSDWCIGEQALIAFKYTTDPEFYINTVESEDQLYYGGWSGRYSNFFKPEEDDVEQEQDS